MTANSQLQASYAKHVKYMVLDDPNYSVECAILRTTPTGDHYYVTIESLDYIDRNRLVNILSRPNSHQTPLWEVMQYVTLNNGVNALEYFHQLVYVKTASGAIMRPTFGRMGTQSVPKSRSVTEATVHTSQQTQPVVQTTPTVSEAPVPTFESVPASNIDGVNVEQLLKEINAPETAPPTRGRKAAK